MSENENLKEDNVMDVGVTFDGTWSKRGHTANFGVGIVISQDTGKVLDKVVLSKSHNHCKKWARK